jgi:putative DeoR family transcriptional regulator (stage III sporulation protein D)
MIKKRVNEEADYILKTKQTIREIAHVFHVSKSTVHKDLNERLEKIDLQKARQVKKILTYHIEVRHIRGGESTKQKYAKIVR